MFRFLLLISIITTIGACQRKEKPSSNLAQTDILKIDSIAPNVWIHRSYLQTESFGKVECNGLIYKNGDDIVIIDTPVDDSSSTALLSWINANLNNKVKAVVCTHFHEDCIGGIKVFNEQKIPSYAYYKTIEKAQEKGLTAPATGFTNDLIVHTGDHFIQCSYVGAGHTHDNSVVYIPEHKILFGGCLIKAMDADKGYLGDADTLEWSSTIQKVKSQFPEAEIIVPGHGEHGGRGLLDYTEKLFKHKQ